MSNRTPWKTLALTLVLALTACETPGGPTGLPADPQAQLGSGQSQIRVNVLLNRDVTSAILAELGSYGTVANRLDQLDALTLRSTAAQIPEIAALPYVAAVSPDAERKGSPIDPVAATHFTGGLGMWNLDAANVTAGPGFGTRSVPYDGSGVYVGVLDTGLLDTWRQYFPEERIAEEYAKAFGGGPNGATPENPNKWEHDVNSHGTHVTSTILGFNFNGTPITGVAPKATVIPVKVLGQSGSGWSSMIASGIVYIADLKAGPLAGSPVVINMSLGGPVLDAVEKAAIDYAIAKGVIVVAAAGNEGTTGMGYPGAYAPVISAAASGWIGEWTSPPWWYATNVTDPTNPAHFYITDFSSRALAGQDLDVAAPGSWIVGPYQTQNGKTSYFFLGGTSMASPHVAGIVALMAQKNGGLTAAAAETILTTSAIPLPPGCRVVAQPSGPPQSICWGADATGSGLTTADAALAATP